MAAPLEAKKNQNKLTFIFLVFFIPLISFAQAPKKKVVKDSGQKAIVTVDGAAVYESANFDSPVMDYLDRGKSILVSKKVYPGAGGLGAFHKMRIRKGVFGYITDVDIQIKGGASRAEPEAEPVANVDPNDPTQIQPDLEKQSPDEDNSGGGLYLTRYLGINLAQYDYTEKIAKKTASGDFTLFGVKMTGPGSLAGGFPLDLELNFAFSAPDAYDKYYKSADGFMLLGHAIFVIPFIEFKRGLIYYGAGVAGKYFKYDVVTKAFPNSSAIDAQDLVIGLAGELGFAYQIASRYALRADLRYYYEKEAYLGYALSLGTQF